MIELILERTEFFLAVITPILFAILGYFAGKVTAMRHERSLARRQPAVRHIRSYITNPIHPVPGPRPPIMLTSEVTMGIDHFRGLLGQLKSLIGGQVMSYQTVLDRARREVMTRMHEQALSLGYNAIANIRIDFVDVSGTAMLRRKASMVSILATGTAYYSSEAPAPLAEKT